MPIEMRGVGGWDARSELQICRGLRAKYRLRSAQQASGDANRHIYARCTYPDRHGTTPGELLRLTYYHVCHTTTSHAICGLHILRLADYYDWHSTRSFQVFWQPDYDVTAYMRSAHTSVSHITSH